MKGSRGSKSRTFEPPDTVLVKNFGSGPTWLYGQVVKSITLSMYEVQLADGRTVRRHVDQMRRCNARSSQQFDSTTPKEALKEQFTSKATAEPNIAESIPTELTMPPLTTDDVVPDSSEANEESVKEPVQTIVKPAQPIRMSNRQKKPPAKFVDYVMTRP